MNTIDKQLPEPGKDQKADCLTAAPEPTRKAPASLADRIEVARKRVIEQNSAGRGNEPEAG